MTVYETNKSLSARIVQVVLIVFCVMVSFVCLFPFLNVLSLSLSSVEAILSGKVTLFPVGFNTQAYARVLSNPTFITSFNFTVFLTFTYTAIAMFMTIICAYPLSRKELKGRGAITTFIIITMYFSGGVIPSYLVVRSLGLIDTMWALILPSAMSAFNMIIMRSFFSSIDNSLRESAYLDGCSELGILLKIVLPLSTPVIATITLFYAVHRWNAVSDAIYYITSPERYPLQIKLRELILMEMVSQEEGNIGPASAKTIGETMKSASIILVTLPILAVYPFLQRYFTKGIMLGAVKG